MEAMVHLDFCPSKIVVFIVPLNCQRVDEHDFGFIRSICTGVGYDRKGGYWALATSDWCLAARNPPHWGASGGHLIHTGLTGLWCGSAGLGALGCDISILRGPLGTPKDAGRLACEWRKWLAQQGFLWVWLKIQSTDSDQFRLGIRKWNDSNP